MSRGEDVGSSANTRGAHHTLKQQQHQQQQQYRQVDLVRVLSLLSLISTIRLPAAQVENTIDGRGARIASARASRKGEPEKVDERELSLLPLDSLHHRFLVPVIPDGKLLFPFSSR